MGCLNRSKIFTNTINFVYRTWYVWVCVCVHNTYACIAYVCRYIDEQFGIDKLLIKWL